MPDIKGLIAIILQVGCCPYCLRRDGLEEIARDSHNGITALTCGVCNYTWDAR